MHVTINDAINAFNLLREHVNENGFLHECYNLGISALKTVQDGNYQLPAITVSRETLETLAEFSCEHTYCGECIYCKQDEDGYYTCMSLMAKRILTYERYIKEVEAWINQNVMN